MIKSIVVFLDNCGNCILNVRYLIYRHSYNLDKRCCLILQNVIVNEPSSSNHDWILEIASKLKLRSVETWHGSSARLGSSLNNVYLFEKNRWSYENHLNVHWSKLSKAIRAGSIMAGNALNSMDNKPMLFFSFFFFEIGPALFLLDTLECGFQN